MSFTTRLIDGIGRRKKSTCCPTKVVFCLLCEKNVTVCKQNVIYCFLFSERHYRSELKKITLIIAHNEENQHSYPTYTNR